MCWNHKTNKKGSQIKALCLSLFTQHKLFAPYPSFEVSFSFYPLPLCPDQRPFPELILSVSFLFFSLGDTASVGYRRSFTLITSHYFAFPIAPHNTFPVARGMRNSFHTGFSPCVFMLRGIVPALDKMIHRLCHV